MQASKKKKVIVYACLAALAIIALAIFIPCALTGGLNGDVVMWVVGALVVVLLISVALIVGSINFASKSRYFTAQNITKLAVFTALSYILYMFIKFPLPFIFPNFLELQISDVPALLAGFMMGPVSGCLVIVLKVLLKLPFSATAMVGELGDLIIGIAFVLPASLIYRALHNKKGAALSLVCSSVCCIAAALIVNRFILIPFFANQFAGMEAVVGLMKPLYPKIEVDTIYDYYLWLAVLPFNVLRCLISAFVTFVLYKSLRRFFDRAVPVNIIAAPADNTGEGKNDPNAAADNDVSSSQT